MQTRINNELPDYSTYEQLLAPLAQALSAESHRVVYCNVGSASDGAQNKIILTSKKYGEFLFGWQGNSNTHYVELMQLCSALESTNLHCDPLEVLQVTQAASAPTGTEYPFLIFDRFGNRLGEFSLGCIKRPDQDLSGSAWNLEHNLEGLGFCGTLMISISQNPLRVGDRLELGILPVYFDVAGRKFYGDICSTHGICRYLLEKECPMEDQRSLCGVSETLPIELCLGELELTAEQVLALRPGTQIEFEASTFETVLKFGNAQWAKGTITFEGDKCTLHVKKVLDFSLSHATSSKNLR